LATREVAVVNTEEKAKKRRGGWMVNRKKYYWLMKNSLTNQFSVKVKKTKNAGRLHFLSWKPCSTRRQRGWAKYCDSENFKAVPRIFCGVKIAPLPLPVLFPRAAAPSGTN
jgi:hypothetical protein